LDQTQIEKINSVHIRIKEQLCPPPEKEHEFISNNRLQEGTSWGELFSSPLKKSAREQHFKILRAKSHRVVSNSPVPLSSE